VSHRLAERAERYLKDKRGPKGKSQCQSFARTSYEDEYGDIFHDDNPPTATDAAWEWSQTKYARAGGNWGAVGDIYYWFGTPDQPAGHAAIRIPGNRVAENSIIHHKATGDGRGTRKLTELRGFPDLIVRLPSVRPSKTLGK
jgi:hypothetical protein